jgi:hypothetical protein
VPWLRPSSLSFATNATPLHLHWIQHLNVLFGITEFLPKKQTQSIRMACTVPGCGDHGRIRKTVTTPKADIIFGLRTIL